ncbi:MAG: Synechococcus phage [Pseudomonadota bacterium]
MDHPQNKKVLITGGAGFIAHHMIAHLIKNTDWNIVTLDRLDISGNLNRLHEILEQFSSTEKKRLKIVFHDLKFWFKNECGLKSD